MNRPYKQDRQYCKGYAAGTEKKDRRRTFDRHGQKRRLLSFSRDTAGAVSRERNDENSQEYFLRCGPPSPLGRGRGEGLSPRYTAPAV